MQDLNISQQRPKPKISIKDTTEVVCDKCNHNVFQLGVLIRKVSPILTGTGYPSYVPFEDVAYYCVKCGHVNNEFIPAELKSNNIIS
jgi:hypothetical protein